MDKSGLEHFKEVLSQQSREIEHTIEQMKENKAAEQDEYSPTELSNYDNHPAEIATQLYEVEHNNAIRVHEEYLLKQVHEALKKIEKGLFGTCSSCGREIGEERLEVIPYAALCIDCEEEESKDMKLLRKKPPFIEQELRVKKYLDAWDSREFEGLDYLNDLMKYGSSDTPQDMGENRDLEEFYTNEIDKQGIVDNMDEVTNDEYKRQLPD